MEAAACIRVAYLHLSHVELCLRNVSYATGKRVLSSRSQVCRSRWGRSATRGSSTSASWEPDKELKKLEELLGGGG